MGGEQRGAPPGTGDAAAAAGAGAGDARGVRGAGAAGRPGPAPRHVAAAGARRRHRGPRRARHLAHPRGNAPTSSARLGAYDIQTHRGPLHRFHRLRTTCASRRFVI